MGVGAAQTMRGMKEGASLDKLLDSQSADVVHSLMDSGGD